MLILVELYKEWLGLIVDLFYGLRGLIFFYIDGCMQGQC